MRLSLTSVSTIPLAEMDQSNSMKSKAEANQPIVALAVAKRHFRPCIQKKGSRIQYYVPVFIQVYSAEKEKSGGDRFGTSTALQITDRMDPSDP